MSDALSLFKRKKKKKKKMKGKEKNMAGKWLQNYFEKFSLVDLQQDLVIPPRFGAGWKL